MIPQLSISVPCIDSDIFIVQVGDASTEGVRRGVQGLLVLFPWMNTQEMLC